MPLDPLLSLILPLIAGASASELPADNPKVRVARRILDDMVDTHGPVGPLRRRPRLFIRRPGAASGHRVAWTDPKREAIVIDEPLYDLLREHSAIELEDGLALILGHELAHIALHPGWLADFGRLGPHAESTGARGAGAALEAEADEVGAFFAFVAGYDTLGLGPEVVDAIYDGYGLDEELGGYPPRARRREIAARTGSKAREAVAIYAAGVLTAALGAPEVAVDIFDHLVRRYESIALLDAAAVAALQRIASLDRDRRPLPIGFRVPKGIGDGAIPKSGSLRPRVAQESLLERATRWLDRAIARDPQQPALHVHAGVAALFANQPKRAVEAAGRARSAARKRHRYDASKRARAEAAAWLLEAQADLTRGQKEAGRKKLRTAARLGSPEARQALELDGPKEDDASPPSPTVRPWPQARVVRVPHDDHGLTIRWSRDRPLPTRLEIRAEGHAWRLSATKTGDGAKTDAGLEKGATREEAIRRHGRPSATVSTGRGRFLRYGEKTGLIVHLTREDRVQGWWMFERVEAPEGE